MFDALRVPPCHVSFSGGRDSSAVLAVASHVARREGLPPPVPVSYAFPGVPAAAEDDWQQMVIRHLGLPDWERIEIRDELDYLGDVARRALERHGDLYPANAHFQGPAIERASGGTLLTGWGGDDVFDGWRLQRVGMVLRGGARPTGTDARRCAFWASPLPVRRGLLRRFGRLPLEWLAPAARRRVYRDWAVDYASQPRRFDRWLHWLRRHTYVWATESTITALGDDAGTRVAHPLIDARFLAALARDCGALGPGDRATAWRRLFGDLLPEAVLTRRSKAFFGDVFLGRHSREFLATWRGQGLDPAVVDRTAMEAALRLPNTAYRLGLLLQWAWRRSVRLGVE